MARPLDPGRAWIDDWLVGTDPTREALLAGAFMDIFRRFWMVEGLGESSESASRRHSGGLHALGGYLVSRGLEPEPTERTAHELLWEAVELDEGPLIFSDNEAWQEELDTTCRRLRRYLEWESFLDQ